MSWWIWLLIALAVGVIELTTLTFVLLWIAIAGLITALISPFVTNIWAQVFVLAVMSTVLLVATRPLARNWKTTRHYKSRMEELLGEQGVVVTEAAPGAFATVRIQGELWSARCEAHLEAGDKVSVTSAKAAVLEVAKV